jgi:hypothetical protein
MSEYWRVAREWNGQRCFIVAGGPSVAEFDLDQLKGQRVIVINSSWSRVPFADLLFFGDARWWGRYRDEVLQGFAGRIATSARGVGHPRVLRLRAHTPPGLASEPDTVAIRRTSTLAAMNLAVHLGVAQIVLVGVDNRVDHEGRTHHHAAYPWDLRATSFDEQRFDFSTIVEPLKRLGVFVMNASPESALPFWPRAPIAEVLANEADAIDQRNARARG